MSVTGSVDAFLNVADGVGFDFILHRVWEIGDVLHERLISLSSAVVSASLVQLQNWRRDWPRHGPIIRTVFLVLSVLLLVMQLVLGIAESQQRSLCLGLLETGITLARVAFCVWVLVGVWLLGGDVANYIALFLWLLGGILWVGVWGRLHPLELRPITSMFASVALGDSLATVVGFRRKNFSDSAEEDWLVLDKVDLIFGDCGIVLACAAAQILIGIVEAVNFSIENFTLSELVSVGWCWLLIWFWGKHSLFLLPKICWVLFLLITSLFVLPFTVIYIAIAGRVFDMENLLHLVKSMRRVFQKGVRKHLQLLVLGLFGKDWGFVLVLR